MKKILSLFAFVFLLNCADKKQKDFAILSENPGFNIKIKKSKISITQDSLNIRVPNGSPLNYFHNYIFSDTLFFGIKDYNSLDVYNLRTQQFVKNIEIARHELTSEIQSLYVKSLDSIYVLNNYPPVFYHINYVGDLLNKYEAGVLNLNIENERVPKNEVIYNFTNLNYQKPFILNNLIYLPINPFDSHYVPGFTKAERIGVYDLKDRKWLKSICPPKGVFSIENVFFNYDLSSPNYIFNNKKIYISYPMDHYIYVYDVEGNFIDKMLASSSYIKSLPSPLNKNQLKDFQYSWNFRIQTPFYGPLFHHKDINLYSRVFYQQQELYKSNGELNDGAKRTAYLIVFNSNLEKIDEIEFTNGSLGVSKVSPLNDGILVGKSKAHWDNENEFIHKYVYKMNPKF